MAVEIAVYGLDGQEKKKIELNEKVFGFDYKPALIAEVALLLRENQRLGTRKTKTRSEVRGGGRKPWRQKGTGRARQGSIRAPHWVGGAVAHGPKVQEFYNNIPRRKRNGAIRSLLSFRLGNGEVKVIEKVEFEKPSVKEMKQALEKLQLAGEKIVVFYSGEDKNLKESLKNFGNVRLVRAENINAYIAMLGKVLLFTEPAIKQIEDALLRGSELKRGKRQVQLLKLRRKSA